MDSGVAQVAQDVLSGKAVFVTGATGAFGRAFVDRCLSQGASRVVAFARNEAKLAQLQAQITDSRLRCVLGDIRDEARLREAMRGCELVVHAAALKRIEVCQSHPDEAEQTNIAGSRNVARAAIANGVRLAVFLSTDKAASPETLYGNSKAFAEGAWVARNAQSAGTGTAFVATRYGNVLGSTGSVVPIWKAQAITGQITVTDPNATRFWMTMDEAVDLVLTSIAHGRPGAVYVPKILAASVGTLAGVVAPDAERIVTGFRASEKVHEVLISNTEAQRTYDCGGFYLIDFDKPTWGTLSALPFPKVPKDFEYTSENAEPWLPSELDRLVAA